MLVFFSSLGAVVHKWGCRVSAWVFLWLASRRIWKRDHSFQVQQKSETSFFYPILASFFYLRLISPSEVNSFGFLLIQIQDIKLRNSRFLFGQLLFLTYWLTVFFFQVYVISNPTSSHSFNSSVGKYCRTIVNFSGIFKFLKASMILRIGCSTEKRGQEPFL